MPGKNVASKKGLSGGKAARAAAAPRTDGFRLAVVVHPAEEGGFWAEVPALRGCVSEGDTLDEVVANIREAAPAGSRRPLGRIPQRKTPPPW